MKCYNCGADLPDNAAFCGSCGAQQPVQPDNGYMYYENLGGSNGNNNKGNNNKGNKPLLIVLIVLSLIIFLTAIIIGTFVIADNKLNDAKETPSPSPTSTATAAPSPTPIATPAVTPQVIYVTEEPRRVPPPQDNYQPPAQQVSGYRTYYSSKYNFSCAYPASFSVYDDNGSLTLYTVKSPDGMGVEKIVARPNQGETVSSELSAFKRAYAGAVTYESSGSDYFAVNILNGSMEYYKYCKFKNGNLYWFEFVYPHAQHDIYDIYVNDVYQSMYNSLN